MYSKSYINGFMDKLAEFDKSAKMRYEMTPEELAADKKRSIIQSTERSKAIPQRIPADPVAYTFKDKIKKNLLLAKRQAKSLGHGLAAAGKVTALRAGEGAADMALFLPQLADQFLFGTIGGVDEGRGFLGRKIGKFHRWMDKKVHDARKVSDDYDYRNRIDSNFNRFLHGAAADTVGSFLGFGGLAGLGRKGIASVLGPAFGAVGAYSSALTDGQHKQLRDRESMLRRLGPDRAYYYDPTATATHQINAPTREEYRRYHLPRTDLPTSWSGKIRVPRAWRYSQDGSPVQFREFGT